MRTDSAKRILNIGDHVAFILPNYRSMVIGKIVKFTPKMTTIEYKNTDINRYDSEVCRIDYTPEDLANILKG